MSCPLLSPPALQQSLLGVTAFAGLQALWGAFIHSDGKEFACQCRRPGFSPWVGKIPWESEWLSTPVFLPEKSHGQRRLAGYSPRGRKDSDTTE